jgi:uncharacterized lipoprotein NlpE involved in copper resistance
MVETSHDDLRYTGQDGEPVIVTVEAHDTVLMVDFTLDGATQSLAAGDSINFQLHTGTNALQLNMDSVPPGGSYRVAVQTVTNEPDNECVHVFTHRGSILVEDFRFFV